MEILITQPLMADTIPLMVLANTFCWNLRVMREMFQTSHSKEG